MDNHEIEKLYHRCRKDGKHPDCEIFQADSEMILKGTIPEIDGYISVTFKPTEVKIQ